MKYKVKKDTLISEIVKKSPKIVELFENYGLHCATCVMAQFETIEQGAKLHGMTDREVDKMIQKINKILKNSKK